MKLHFEFKSLGKGNSCKQISHGKTIFGCAREESFKLEFEYESYSWKDLFDLIAVKQMEKFSFLHHGTGIPIEIRSFFDIDSLSVGDKKTNHLILWNKKFCCSFLEGWEEEFENPSIVVEKRFPKADTNKISRMG